MPVRVLKTVTFVYGPREDRILAAINAGNPEAWSCWLTRRIVLVLLERAEGLLASTSALAQRAPAEARGELVAFERDAAIANTAKSMSRTPPDVLKTSGPAAELVDRLTISGQGDKFRVELQGGESGGGAVGMVARAELQRILQMLQAEVAKANWSIKPSPAPAAEELAPKPARH
jgi:hypothetical protein